MDFVETRRVRFVERYLSPENRLAEVICGLVMVLSFTTTATAAFRELTPQELLIAILGCNAAWGIVDGMTYVLGNLLLRGQRAHLVNAVQKADPQEGLRMIREKFNNILCVVSDPAEREQIERRLLEGAKRLRPAPARVERQDIYTALACFIVVFSCTLPVAVPFMLLHDKAMALRLSNLVGLVALFICGYRWGGLAGTNRLWTGTVMLLLGGVLVAITVALGG